MTGAADRGPGMKLNNKPPVDKGADFANYFCTYAFLYHQKEMLSDRVRMEAYYKAVFRNARHFKDKVVLDVGTGSGILAIWAAKAGARKVYAVEATDMAQHAKKLVVSNNVGNIVEVIQGSVEDTDLPEKVDVIISEWMGYFLVRESMFDSVIAARDRWLKPDGIMYPSHARMWLAPMRSNLNEQKRHDFENSVRDWSAFEQDTKYHFQVDMSVLTDAYETEQRKFFLQTSMWDNLFPHQIVGQSALVKEMDCKTASVAEIECIRSEFRMPMLPASSVVSGFAGWFDVQFKGSQENPADSPVELTTAPSVEDTTHWGQQVFLLHPPVAVNPADTLCGTVNIARSKHNHRLMDVSFEHRLQSETGTLTDLTASQYWIE
eukprot:jgi/Mesen1/6387/ME000329S05556